MAYEKATSVMETIGLIGLGFLLLLVAAGVVHSTIIKIREWLTGSKPTGGAVNTAQEPHQTSAVDPLRTEMATNQPTSHRPVVDLPPEPSIPELKRQVIELARRLGAWKHSDGEERRLALDREAKTIGEAVNRAGGKSLMVSILNELRAKGIYVRAVEMHWDGIGDFRG